MSEQPQDENEILAEYLQNSRPLINMSFSRKRSTFGNYMTCVAYDASESYRFSASFVDPRFQTLRATRDWGVQNVVPKRTAPTQTTTFRKLNKTIQTATVQVDESNVEIDQSKLNDFLFSKKEEIVRAISSNGKFNLFEDDFAKLAADDSFFSKTDAALKNADQTFTPHLDSKGKVMTSIDWQPKSKGVVAFTMVDSSGYEERLKDYGVAVTSYVVVWNFADPIYPQVILKAPSDVLVAKFNPTQPNIVVGGLANGQVIMWDLSMKKKDKKELGWKALSLIESSHSGSVNDIQWLMKKEMKNEKLVDLEGDIINQFMTIGSDGKLLIFDCRISNLKSIVKASLRKKEKYKDAWLHYHSMQLFQIDGATEVSGQSLSLDKENPYKFTATSQDGDFVIGDWTPEIVKDDDDSQPEQIIHKKQIVQYSIRTDEGGHFGVAHTIRQHPFFPDIYMTIGDWSFKIWKLNCHEPLWTSRYSDCMVACGKWSPTRPSVAYIGKTDGTVEVWDMLDKSHDPSMKITVNTQAQINSFEFRVGQGARKNSVQILAVGTSIGTLHVLEMPRNLIKPLNSEQQLMQQFLEREENRVTYYRKRWLFHEQEIREKQLEEKNKKQEKTKEEAPVVVDYQALTEKFLKLIEAYQQDETKLFHDPDQD